jgi:hypothetical protein
VHEAAAALVAACWQARQQPRGYLHKVQVARVVSQQLHHPKPWLNQAHRVWQQEHQDVLTGMSSGIIWLPKPPKHSTL